VIKNKPTLKNLVTLFLESNETKKSATIFLVSWISIVPGLFPDGKDACNSFIKFLNPIISVFACFQLFSLQ